MVRAGSRQAIVNFLGGNGGIVKATIPVTPGETLAISSAAKAEATGRTAVRMVLAVLTAAVTAAMGSAVEAVQAAVVHRMCEKAATP